MITVEVIFPAINRSYEFSLSEHDPVTILIGEIAELICQSEHITPVSKINKFMLCDIRGRRILPSASTLAQAGIQSGARLMLL